MSAGAEHQAPWFVIPSNHKWLRDLAISQIITRSLENPDMKLPKPTVDLAEIARKYHAAAEEWGARTKADLSQQPARRRD
jgi:hypothetical protein